VGAVRPNWLRSIKLPGHESTGGWAWIHWQKIVIRICLKYINISMHVT